MGTTRSKNMAHRTKSTLQLLLLLIGNLALAFGKTVHDVEFTVNLGAGKTGTFLVEVHPDWAPHGAARFMEMVESDFFKGNRFFRVMDGFVAQFGIHGKPSVAAEWSAKTLLDDPSGAVTMTKGTLAFATKINKDGPKYGPLTGKPNKLGQQAYSAMHGKESRATQMFINLEHNLQFSTLGMTPFAMVKMDTWHVVEQLNSVYGETAAGKGSGSGPDQARIQAEGNHYLKMDFPKLSYIVSARVLKMHKEL